MVKIPLSRNIPIEKKAYGIYESNSHVVYLDGLSSRYQPCLTRIKFCELSDSISKDERRIKRLVNTRVNILPTIKLNLAIHKSSSCKVL